MTTDLRFSVVNWLKQTFKDRDVAELAREHGVTIIHNGKVNKGWVGQTLDRAAHTAHLNASRPDGPDFELKSVHVIFRGSEWVPKETVAITMFNPVTILRETFEDSALWHKLERLILVGHAYPDGRRDAAFIKSIKPFDVSDPTLREKVEEYWHLIRSTVQEGRISTYSSKGTSKGYIQLRTKGSGKSKSLCPITGQSFNTRAFYATKPFIRYVFGNMN